MDLPVRLAALIALVFANGFFVAAEYAIVSVRRSRVEELARHNGIAAMVLRAKNEPNRFISAAQVGITVSSLALGWLGVDLLVSALSSALAELDPPLSETVIQAVSLVGSFTLLTILHVVLGEQVPKLISVSFSERVAVATVAPTEALYLIFRPIIALVAAATHLVLRILRVPTPSEREAALTSDELELMFQVSHQAGVLEESERDLLVNVLEFTDLVVEEIMVPRPDVVAIEVSTPFDEVLRRADESPHSRFPVYQDTLDNVVGILHIRMLLRALRSRRPPPVDLRPLLRPPLFVPESMSVPDLFKRFRAERVPLAIVLDEYGGMAGLVTIEDVLEEIFGEMDDEFHEAEAEILPQADGSFLLLPRLHLRDFNDELGHDLESDEADTVAGYVLDKLGRLPQPGDAVELSGGVIRVEAMDGPRIRSLRYIPRNSTDRQLAEEFQPHELRDRR